MPRITLQQAFDMGVSGWLINPGKERSFLQAVNQGLADGSLHAWDDANGGNALAAIQSPETAYLDAAEFHQWFPTLGRKTNAGISFAFSDATDVKIDGVSGFEQAVDFRHSTIRGIDARNLRRTKPNE